MIEIQMQDTVCQPSKEYTVNTFIRLEVRYKQHPHTFYMFNNFICDNKLNTTFLSITVFYNTKITCFRLMISPFEQSLEMGFPTCLSSDPADEQHSSQEKVAFRSKLPQIYTLYSRYQSQECTVNPVTIFSHDTCKYYFQGEKTSQHKILNLNQNALLTLEKNDPQSSGARYHLVAT